MFLFARVDISAATPCGAKHEVDLAVGPEKVLSDQHTDRHRWHEDQCFQSERTETPRDRQHDQRSWQQPRERKLHHADVVTFRLASNALPFLRNEGFLLPPIGAHGMIPIFSRRLERKIKIDRLPRRWYSLLDYVIRRFNLSSARLNKPKGTGSSLRHRLARSPRSNWCPESAEVRPLFQSAL
jgi:hypothetical protein